MNGGQSLFLTEIMTEHGLFSSRECLGANVWGAIVLDPNNSKYIPLEVTISLVLQGIS